MDGVQRSKCVIEAILADVVRRYKPAGGGGITSIKQDATTTYSVSIAQEERIDVFVYQVEVDAKGGTRIVDVKSETRSPGR